MLRLRVKEEAQARGFTIARLERTAGIDIKTVRAIWHNPRHNASFETLEKIAAAIGVPVTDLIEDEASAVRVRPFAQKPPLEEVMENLQDLDRLAYAANKNYAKKLRESASSMYANATPDELEHAQKLQTLLPGGLKVLYVQEYHAYGIFAVDTPPKS